MASESIIKFPTNVPVELALKFDTGIEVQSQFSGDQVCYTTEYERRFYVAPVVSRMITDAGITRGIPFTVCKAEVREGMRKRIQWQVQRLDTDAMEPGRVAAPAKSTTTPQATDLHSNGSNGKAHAIATQRVCDMKVPG